MSNRESTERLAHWVHGALLLGVIASGLILTAGVYRDPTLGTREPTSQNLAIPEVLRGSLQGEGIPLINLGLLLLMATPVLRISVLALGWLIKGDIRFAVVALIVLGLLLLSIKLGLG